MMNYEPGVERYRCKVARRMATHIRRLAVEMYAALHPEERYYYESVIDLTAYAVGITADELRAILDQARRYDAPELRIRGGRGR